MGIGIRTTATNAPSAQIAVRFDTGLDAGCRRDRVAWLRRTGAPTARGRLSPQAEPLDQGAVPLYVHVLEVAQLPAPLADQHQQAAPRVEIVPVLPQMLGEVLDAIREDRDLHLRRTGVAVVSSVVTDDGLLVFGCLHGVNYDLSITTHIACPASPTREHNRIPLRSM